MAERRAGRGDREQVEERAQREQADTGLPPGVETAWGLRERPSRGPARVLDVRRIVAAAVALADTEGLGAVSMSRVAAEAGASTMGLYRYVAGKDELLILMEDAAIGPPPPGPPAEDGWRAGLEHWARSLGAVYERRPWLLRIPISTPPLSPRNVEWMEQALTYLRGTRLPGEERLGVLALLSGFVRNHMQLFTDMAEANRQSGTAWADMEDRYWLLLERLTDSRRFPAITELLESGEVERGEADEEPGTSFDFGLARTLDGVAVLVAGEGG
ncbi:TetR/AcrR family transcriptional regulator [Streptomyces boncukensis]|uniref:TetR/AcrR family transcriptional regulator n=1 Tax=Streptomyces boncukensis TaxID=2711219 RepID=A0A6G4WQV6_9ACTN|nr:TetR/AcrR family transcriptional regulator [Streptomyces boncukensis]NGO67646.1 TetR/AcrR family transcriptional regulator [Streptomyces boncukensis]